MGCGPSKEELVKQEKALEAQRQREEELADRVRQRVGTLMCLFLLLLLCAVCGVFCFLFSCWCLHRHGTSESS